MFHSTDLYNSQTHVPLVIAGPGIKPQRIQETVSLVDLTATLLELAGFAPPTDLDGVSFADLANGKRAQNAEGGAAYSAMIFDRLEPRRRHVGRARSLEVDRSTNRARALRRARGSGRAFESPTQQAGDPRHAAKDAAGASGRGEGMSPLN